MTNERNCFVDIFGGFALIGFFLFFIHMTTSKQNPPQALIVYHQSKVLCVLSSEKYYASCGHRRYGGVELVIYRLGSDNAVFSSPEGGIVEKVPLGSVALTPENELQKIFDKKN